jgi:hypothetical protein
MTSFPPFVAAVHDTILKIDYVAPRDPKPFSRLSSHVFSDFKSIICYYNNWFGK